MCRGVVLCFTGYEKTQSLRFCLALGDAWLKDPNLEVGLCDTIKSWSLTILFQFFVGSSPLWAGGSTGKRRNLPLQAEAAVPAFCDWKHTDIQPAEQPRPSEADWAPSQTHSGPVWAQQCGAAIQRQRSSKLSWWASWCANSDLCSYPILFISV